MIKCFIFDLDDTLYYEKMYVLEAFKNVCRYISKKNNKDINKLYKECVDILDEYGRGRVFNILCENNNLKEDISKLVSIYRHTEPKLELYLDSIEFIEYIKYKSMKTGIITDGCSKVQWNKIRALGLERVIDKIIVTNDYGQGFSKPNKKSYIDIIEHFNVKPEESVYIGDNPTKDFIGAKEIGMKTIRIIRNTGDHINKKVTLEYEADKIITNLLELKEYL
ncbi:HAD family hydrolase [Clostridium butyricum]|uniref:HAD family hydrolase n=1 Tax=Clostridium butyricum TaxID=1492 RepID=UPI00374F9387